MATITTENDFPAAPANVPADLTRPTAAYKSRILLVFVSILFFLALYAGLIGGSGYAVYYASQHLEDDGAFLWLVPIAGLLFLFLVKVLFKRGKRDRSAMIEITEADEPRFFAFLHELVAETAAPFPKRVYITSEVNAAVFYDSSALNLILPVRKNLLIGLGAVNMLNLTEMKAVLAHEFGHFGQNSMKLGTYVYVSNRLIADMIWSRDKWDEMVSVINRLDLRIAWVGWIVTAVTWLLRHFLGLLFKGINIAHAALSRQMEFAADKVAVASAGSDALCHALVKLEFADACMEQSLSDLSDAVDHKLYTDDMFLHQERAADYLRRRDKRPDWGIPPALPDDPAQTTQIFDKDSDTQPSMWASHPPDYDRETNCKATYIRSNIDERSAWILFSDPAALRRNVTEHFMKSSLGPDVVLSPAEEAQKFIDDERAEIMHDERYRGAYDSRMLDLSTMTELLDEARNGKASETPEELGLRLDALYDSEFEQKIAEREALLAEQQAVLRQLNRDKVRKVAFRGQDYKPKQFENIFEQLGQDLQASETWFDAHDQRMLEAHLRIASVLPEPWWREELEQRYRFQDIVQRALRQVREAGGYLDEAAQILQLDEDEIDPQTLMNLFAMVHQHLVAAHSTAEGAQIPPLANFEAQELGAFLLPEPLPPEADALPLLTGEWMSSMANHHGMMQSRLNRLIVKGVGGILRHQEALVGRWRAEAI